MSEPEKPLTASPETLSDLCHDTASMLSATGEVLPAPAGPVVKAAGAVVEVACDVYDLTHEINPNTPAGDSEKASPQ